MVRVVGLLPPPFNWRPSDARVINRFESPPTAGMFTRVPSKPTNHSKFTSKCRKAKCGGCHEHPVSKSKNKTKGTYKVRSSDDELNIYGGSSASGMLAILSGSREDDIDDEIEDDLHRVGFHQTEIEESSSSTAAVEVAIQPENKRIQNVIELYDLEDWCLVD